MQQECVDYEKIFSQVIRFTLIYRLLSSVIHFDLELNQMNEKTTFLSHEYDRWEIYMQQPIRFVEQGQENKLCKLQS